jgi:hypothetical protein
MEKRTQRQRLQRLAVVQGEPQEVVEVVVEIDAEIGRRIDVLAERIRGGDVPEDFARHLATSMRIPSV